MKKYFLLLCMSMLAFTIGKAQYVSDWIEPGTVTQFSNSTSNPSGAVTNTSTDTAFLRIKGPMSQMTFVFTVAKLSGTVGGSAILYGSLDNSAFVPLDTITLENLSKSYAITKTSNPYMYYQVRTTGTGTMSALVWTKAFVRR